MRRWVRVSAYAEGALPDQAAPLTTVADSKRRKWRRDTESRTLNSNVLMRTGAAQRRAM